MLAAPLYVRLKIRGKAQVRDKTESKTYNEPSNYSDISQWILITLL